MTTADEIAAGPTPDEQGPAQGIIADVQQRTADRKDAVAAAEAADRAWRDSIREALNAGRSATEIAGAAEIHRSRVYQILHGTR